MPKTIYVGNLSFEVTENELHQAFSQCGQVISAKIVKDEGSGRSKGFAFVEMANIEEANLAIERMTGHDLKGRPLVVNEARKRSGGRERNDSGGGYGKRRA